MTADPSMFDLQDVVPSWQGRRALYVEAPLRRGIEVLRERLVAAEALVIEYQVQFDYDGPFDRIGRLQPFAREEAMSALLAMEKEAVGAALAAHTTWKIIERQVHAANIMPFTGAKMPQHFPDQVAATAVGDASLYEKLYLRYYVLHAAETELLDQLFAYSGLQDALVKYFASPAWEQEP